MTLNRVINTVILSTAIGLNGLVGSLTPAYGQEVAKVETKQEQTKPSITNEEIERLMKKKTVEEILEGAPVEYVRYDPKKGKTNFDELVYQKHLRPDQRKPVMVMWYSNKDSKRNGTCQRAAIAYRKTSEFLHNLVRFICFHEDADPILVSENYSGIIEKFGVRSSPSFAIYPCENGGISQEDLLKGGPLGNEGILKYVQNLIYWVQINQDRSNPDYKKYILGNSSEWKKVNSQ